MVQYSRAAAWHPDWAWSTPAGFSDYPYALNFTLLNVPANGTGRAQSIPVRGPDDADFLVRSIYLPKLAIVPADIRSSLDDLDPIPGLMRLNVAGRQSSSNEFVLTGGAWCNGGLPGFLGPGVSLVDPLVIPARGVVTFDLQLTTNAAFAQTSFEFGSGSILFDANVYGTAGNAYTIALVDPGAPNSPLSVSVLGSAVTVSLGTDGLASINTSIFQLITLINADPAVTALMTAQGFGELSESCEARGVTNLVGGSASSPVDVVGALIGHKRKRIC